MIRFAAMAMAGLLVFAGCASTPSGPTPEQQRKYSEAALKIDAAMPAALRGERAALQTVCYQYYARAFDFPSNANKDTDLAYDWCVKAGKAGHAFSQNIVGDILYLPHFNYCACFAAFASDRQREQVALDWYRMADKNGYDSKKEIARVMASLEKSGGSSGTSSAAQQAQAPRPSGGGGFFAGALGGAAAGLLDRNAAMLNSAAASTGGAGGAVMGQLGGVNTQLARETREQVARDMAGSTEGRAGAALSGALVSGNLRNAGGASGNNLAGSLVSGLSGNGGAASVAGALSATGANGGMTASERLASNRALGAPDDFETNNERICRERGARAYCEAGVTERKMRLGGLERFTPPQQGSGTLSAAVKSKAEACATEKPEREGNPQVDSFCQIAQFNTCLDKATGTTTYRVQTDAVCRQLSGLLKATGGGSAGAYCSYCR